MKKTDWNFFEQWATAKAIKFGMNDEWVDLVMWVVSQRVRWERKHYLTNTA